MADKLNQAISKVVQLGLDQHFSSLQRGLEKESLRVSPDGKLAQTPHPAALGSALTHGSITTDYSEALLEFVTPIHTSAATLLQELTDIHHYTYQNMGDEKLWVNSMPCVVESEEKIPIARYGKSNVAKMKEAYRRGLGHRYGRLMQTIAGIHFNFSMPEEFWKGYLDTNTEAEYVAEKSAQYFALTRNFLRHSWLPCYLFGASPAVCKSFLQGRKHNLDEHDSHSYYSHHATSLRLSGLGYSNDAQSSINVSYNSLDEYTHTLRNAIQTPHLPYQDIPKTINGNYQQLNPNMLQIENEFYAVIRPKVVAKSGESPSSALIERGVEYVEVRSLDLNPFVPIGIDETCIHFFDMFLIYCLFANDDVLSDSERQEASENRQRIVMNGREPGIKLTINQQEVAFTDAAENLLNQLDPIADLLDRVNGGSQYAESLAAQKHKISHPESTPSAQILAKIDEGFDSFYGFAMAMAKQHENYFKQQSMTDEVKQSYCQRAQDSIAEQHQIEEEDEMSFEVFLQDYTERQNAV